MKSLRRICLLIGLVAVSSLLFYSCQKDNDSINVPEGQQRVSIRLSDNPVNFDAVNVDIQRVEVLIKTDSCRNNDDDDDDRYDRHGCRHDRDGDRDRDRDDDCLVWDTLDIRAGVYNLLDLSNGVDTLLASGFTLAGDIKKIRITLGTNNSVLIDSVSYPVATWNNYNRVTIKVKGGDIDEITPGDVQLWLDFDAGMSIIKVTRNRFVIKPVIRIWLPSQTSAIRGKVIPREAKAVVAAIANGDTLVAIPDHRDGKFKIRGIRGGTADVLINATANGYRDTVISNVNLDPRRETDLGVIELRQ